VINLITIEININVEHIMKFANFAKKAQHSEKIKIRYTAKTATSTVLNKIVLIITVKFAGRFINAKIVLRFN